MSKIGIATPRKTKFNATTNNPFQGPTAVSFTSVPRPTQAAFITFATPGDTSSAQVKNSTKAFAITRLKPGQAGGPGAAYGDNRRLQMTIAQAQTLSARDAINLVFGVNNNGALSNTSGITSIEIIATDDRDNRIPVIGPANQPGPLESRVLGIFTKSTAAQIAPPVTLRDGDNFNFSLQQAVEAGTPGIDPDQQLGTLWIPQDFLDRLRGPGDQFVIELSITIVYTTPSTGGNPVTLSNCKISLQFVFS